MIWSALFLINIVQGLFLIFLIHIRKSKNFTASALISAMLALMILTNISYLTIRTEIVNYAPQVYGFSFGTLFLFGPLFYLYSKSILDDHFHWHKKNWLHFVPYLIQLSLNIPYFVADKSLWLEFIDQFLSGNLPMGFPIKIIFAIQNLHLLVYLLVTFKWIQSAKKTYTTSSFVIPVSKRIRWLTSLTCCVSLLLITFFSLYLFVVFNGRYNPVTNYIYTMVMSGILYFIAYSFTVKPELISPDFIQKYRTYMPFIGNDGDRYLEKLGTLLAERKAFIDPELKLATVADELGLPQHQVSKLINEKLGKSFTDLINEYRVEEFISRINHPEYQSYSIFGIALDVGFNSKSSFNTAFKKITGKTPSEYRKEA